MGQTYSMKPKPGSLHEAITQENPKLVKSLIKKGADVNEPDDYEVTPLHYAVDREHREIVKMLVNAGARSNVEDNLGKTALHKAILNYNNPMCDSRANSSIVLKILLDAGADVNTQDCMG